MLVRGVQDLLHRSDSHTLAWQAWASFEMPSNKQLHSCIIAGLIHIHICDVATQAAVSCFEYIAQSAVCIQHVMNTLYTC